MSFRVEQPAGVLSPVVVEIPHASVQLDPLALPWLMAPARSIGRDADLYVDDLFAQASRLGATLVVAELSRYVCDLNRAVHEVDSLAVTGAQGTSAPHGFIWRRTTDGAPALASPVPATEYERRVSRHHQPYHLAVAQLLEQRRQQFGWAVLLCAHSMPSRGRVGNSDAGRPRAQIVPGSRGGTTAHARIVAAAEPLALARGWSLSHDDPYRGGYSTVRYGRPDDGIHALQIELSRGLYLDEAELKKTSGFEATRSFCNDLVEALTRFAP